MVEQIDINTAQINYNITRLNDILSENASSGAVAELDAALVQSVTDINEWINDLKDRTTSDDVSQEVSIDYLKVQSASNTFRLDALGTDEVAGIIKDIHDALQQADINLQLLIESNDSDILALDGRIDVIEDALPGLASLGNLTDGLANLDGSIAITFDGINITLGDLDGDINNPDYHGHQTLIDINAEGIATSVTDITNLGTNLSTNYSTITQTAFEIGLAVDGLHIDKITGDILHNASRLTITEDAIRTSVEQTEKLFNEDGSVGTIQHLYTTIDQTAEAITLEAHSRTDFDNGRVALAESGMLLNADAIILHTTAIDGLSDRVETAEVSIEADAITLQVVSKSVLDDGYSIGSLLSLTANAFGVGITEVDGVPYAAAIELLMHPTWRTGTVYGVAVVDPEAAADKITFSDGVVYQCILGHEASLENSPGSASWDTYWVVTTRDRTEFNVLADSFNVYTPGGAKRVFSVNSGTNEVSVNGGLIIGEPDGSVAGASGNGWIMNEDGLLNYKNKNEIHCFWNRGDTDLSWQNTIDPAYAGEYIPMYPNEPLTLPGGSVVIGLYNYENSAGVPHGGICWHQGEKKLHIRGAYLTSANYSWDDLKNVVIDSPPNELEVYLSTAIDKITGDGEGSVTARIEEAKTEILGDVQDIDSIPDYGPTVEYVAGDVIKDNGLIYRCLALTVGNLPTNTVYWLNLGEYSVLGAAFAMILKEETTRTNADGAFSSDVSLLQSEWNDPETGLSTAVLDTMTGTYANLLLKYDTWAGPDGSGGTIEANIIAHFADTVAAVKAVQGAIAGTDGLTHAWDTTTLTTEVDGSTATVQETAESVNGIQGKYSVKIDINDRVVGFGLISEANDGVSVGAFSVVADKFSIANPDAPVATKAPFVFEGGVLKLSGDIQVDGTSFLNSVYAGKLKLDSGNGTPSAAYSTNAGTWGDLTSYFSCTARTGDIGFTVHKTNSGEGSAIYGECSSPLQLGAAVAGYNASISSESYGGFFKANGGNGINCSTSSNSGYGLFTPNSISAGGGVFPFTGSHITYTKDTSLLVGQILIAEEAQCTTVSNSLVLTTRSIGSQDKRVFGVVCRDPAPLMTNILGNRIFSEQDSEEVWVIKSEYTAIVQRMVDEGYQEIGVNAVGEGGILICSENGDIDNGDYICSSNAAGYGMKQADDLLHNYTVAKALEAVVWANESTSTKLIACTYHCG